MNKLEVALDPGFKATASGRLFHTGTARGKKVCCRYWVLWVGTSKEQYSWSGGGSSSDSL